MDFFLLEVDYGRWGGKKTFLQRENKIFALFDMCEAVIPLLRNSRPTAKLSDLVVVYLVFGVFNFLICDNDKSKPPFIGINSKLIMDL